MESKASALDETFGVQKIWSPKLQLWTRHLESKKYDIWSPKNMESKASALDETFGVQKI
jgi:hypothetical protein